MMPQPVLIVNTVCTNVPGPMHPLYANGTELLTYYPHVPCGSDVGISIAMSSYNKSLYFGITYDMQAAPDGELFRDFLVESYEELREAAGVPKALSRPMPARPAEIPIPKPEPESASEPELVAEPASEPEQVAEPVDVSVPEIAEPVTVHAAVNGIPKSRHKKKKDREQKSVKDTVGAH
jgi:diacylglycerol O-acyltransferase